jgi:hypothetical protein
MTNTGAFQSLFRLYQYSHFNDKYNPLGQVFRNTFGLSASVEKPLLNLSRFILNTSRQNGNLCIYLS